MKRPKDSSADQNLDHPGLTGKGSSRGLAKTGDTSPSMSVRNPGAEQSQAKRQRTLDFSASQNSAKGNVLSAMGVMPPSQLDVRLPGAFQAQIGVKKLVIKNLRQDRPVVDLEAHYKKVQNQVLEAVEATLRDEPVKQPLEVLYRNVEDICRSKRSETLYEELRLRCEEYLQNTLLSNMRGTSGRDQPLAFLQLVLAAWKDWSRKTLQIRSIFSFLDRSFLLNSKDYPQLNDMSIDLFSKFICEDAAIDSVLYNATNKMIDNDRTHSEQDPEKWFQSAVLKDIVRLFLVTKLYEPRFEPEFLKSSESFFRRFTTVDRDLPTYILRCVKLLDKESMRCTVHNFNSSTSSSLLRLARAILIEGRSEFVLNTEAVGKLLADHDMESLASLYNLLKSSGIQQELKTPWEEYIKKTGASIISDREKGDDMVVRLLELKRSLDLITRDAFDRDEVFKFAMREAFGSFINDKNNANAWRTGTAKVGEVIAKYMDLLLRGGLKAVPRSLVSDELDRQAAEEQGLASTGDEDAELDRQLEQGLELFRFIEGKDVFEAFYKKDLARRLLMGRSASQDAERNMLTKLKSECGANFTHNLEQMFKDQELSRDEMINYNQSLRNTSRTTMNLQVSVLSSAAWPTYPDIKVNLPAEVARHIEKFDMYYKHKHSGRRLTWKHALAHSIVRAQFAKGVKELQVSGFQAIVLTLFNDIAPSEALSFASISAATALADEELARTLQSLACGKVRILNKHPKGRDVADTDTFTVNVGFTDPKFRIKINQIQLKETKKENEETHERVNLDRQYETQAAIVRIMKSRKVMPHQALVAEVIEQTKRRGAVEVGEIKKNIEKLIEKDYMERDEGNYTYLA